MMNNRECGFISIEFIIIVAIIFGIIHLYNKIMETKDDVIIKGLRFQNRILVQENKRLKETIRKIEEIYNIDISKLEKQSTQSSGIFDEVFD